MKHFYFLFLILTYTQFSYTQVAKTNNTSGSVTNVPANGTHLTRSFTYTAGEFSTNSLTEVEISIQLLLGNGTPPTLGGYGVHEDLNVRLISPTGTIVDLVQDRWGYWTGDSTQSHSFNGFNAVNATVNFDDDSSTNIQTLDNWQSGNYAPHNPLSAFDGENAVGTWTLHISDGNSQFAPNDYIHFVTATLTVTSGAPLSIEDNMLQNKVQLYPNPSTNLITIPNMDSDKEYIIYNITGKLIKKGKISNTKNITINYLKRGTYFLKLNNKHIIKFIKI